VPILMELSMTTLHRPGWVPKVRTAHYHYCFVDTWSSMLLSGHRPPPCPAQLVALAALPIFSPVSFAVCEALKRCGDDLDTWIAEDTRHLLSDHFCQSDALI
jgi:hypothetical protein